MAVIIDLSVSAVLSAICYIWAFRNFGVYKSTHAFSAQLNITPGYPAAVDTALFAQRLDDLFENLTSYSHLQKKWMQMQSTMKQDDTTTSASDDTVVAFASAKHRLETFLFQRLSALKNIVQKTEDLSKDGLQQRRAFYNYCYSGATVLSRCLDATSFKLNEHNEPDNKHEFIKDDRIFHRPVSLSRSGVLIPNGVPARQVLVQRHLELTKALDEVFAANRKASPEMAWQYIGSESGVFRVHPAFEWGTNRECCDRWCPCDSAGFDPRHRPWYGRSLVPPKDIIILLDVSGSVYGQPIRLLQKTAKQLVDGLNDDDHVGVIEFNKNVTFLACFDRLVPATLNNKQALRRAIDKVTVCKDGTYEAALKFSFDVLDEHEEEFRRFAELNGSSEPEGRSKVILLLSDGTPEFPEHLLNIRDPNKTVLITAYQAGLDIIPRGGLQKIACTQQGRVISIDLASKIPRRVLEYKYPLYKRLSSKERPWSLSPIYRDSLGIGPVVTLSLRVHEQDEDMDEEVLGVAGVDIRLRELRDLLGIVPPHIRAMLINRAGHVLYHPNFMQKATFLWNNESVTIDWIHLEPPSCDDKVLTIWNATLQQQPGKTSICVWKRSPDGKHVLANNVTYMHQPLFNNTMTLIFAVEDPLTMPIYNVSELNRPKFDSDLCRTFCMPYVHALVDLKTPGWLVCCDSFITRLTAFDNDTSTNTCNFTTEILETALSRQDSLLFRPVGVCDFGTFNGFSAPNEREVAMFRTVTSSPFPIVLGAFVPSSLLSALASNVVSRELPDKSTVYLLDDGGQVITHGENDRHSQPLFDDLEPKLLQKLIDQSVFEAVEFEDILPPAECPLVSSATKPRFILDDTFAHIIRTLKKLNTWFVNCCNDLIISLAITLAFLFPVLASANAETAPAQACHYRNRNLTGIFRQHGDYCASRETFLYLQRDFVFTHGTIVFDSSKRLRQFSSRHVPGTNILLAIVVKAAQRSSDSNVDIDGQLRPYKRLRQTLVNSLTTATIKQVDVWRPMLTHWNKFDFPVPDPNANWTSWECSFMKFLPKSCTAKQAPHLLVFLNFSSIMLVALIW